jgi:NRPS condensation-like uncharacterized protein
MKLSAPLTKTQYGIYTECASKTGEPCYNLPYLYTLDKSLDAEKLCKAIETAVMAHPTLFTRIELTEEGDPMQTVDMDKEDWRFGTENIEDITDIEQAKRQLVEPFNLYGDRLFHIRLLRDSKSL